MNGGIQLSLFIGPAVPIAVPETVLDALERVKVTSKAVGTSGFELNFNIDVNSPLQTLFLIGGGVSIPLLRVVVAVTFNGSQTVLIDGVMTDHHVGTDVQNGKTTLTLIGEDLTRVMDYFDLERHAVAGDAARSAGALAARALLAAGRHPDGHPELVDGHSDPDRPHTANQRDFLAHIRRLADQCGYVFYLDPGPRSGSSVAYWGPQIKWGPVQPALAIDADASTNVEHLQFSFDNDHNTIPIVIIQEPFDEDPDPDTRSATLRRSIRRSAMIPPIPKKIEITTGAAKWSAMRAALLAMAKASKAADA